MKLKQYLIESTTPKYMVLGINDEQDCCDICGKTNLKRVVWFSKLSPDGEKIDRPFATGTDCAAKLMVGKKQKKVADRIFDNARVIDIVKKWFLRNHSAEDIAKGIWNKFGMQSEAINGGIVILMSPDNKSKVYVSMRPTGEMKVWPKNKYIHAKNWARQGKR